MSIAGVLALLLCAPQAAWAQAFDCDVTVNYAQLSGSDYSFLDQLEGRMEEYVNETRWTDDRFAPVERINCDIQLYFTEASSLTDFRARWVVASRRPIYGTAQSTPVVRFTDPDVAFTYTQGEPFTADLDTYDDLTSVLDFYVYLMLGYDYDTFSELGGTPHFEQARRIAELAISSGGTGWSQLGGTGREELVQQLLNPRLRPLRLAYFNYHYGGLDHFVAETPAARETVMEVLRTLQALYENVSRQYALDLFFVTKYAEIEALFEGSPLGTQAYALLSRLDPAHDYEGLLD